MYGHNLGLELCRPEDKKRMTDGQELGTSSMVLISSQHANEVSIITSESKTNLSARPTPSSHRAYELVIVKLPMVRQPLGQFWLSVS